MIDLIDIVEAVAHRAVTEPVGKKRLHPRDIALQQTENPAGEAALPRVGKKGFHYGFQVAVARGKGVGFAAEFAENHRLALKKGELLVSPEKQRHKGSLRAVAVGMV